MPAPRGRRKSGGGIRKKSDPNRQRLARVVRSGEKRDAKHAKRIAALRASASGASSREHRQEPDEEVANFLKDSGGSNADEREPDGAAYGTLLAMLGPSPTSAPATFPEKPAVKKRPRHVKPEDAKPGKEQKQEAESRPSSAVVEATAASRSASHFEITLQEAEKSAAKDLKSLGNVPKVGRVSASFEAGLPTQPLTDVAALSLQPTIDARWRKAWTTALDPLCGTFVSALRDFRDIVLTRRVSIQQDMHLRRLYVAHAVAHVMRSRARVARHDATLKANGANSEPVRDQGFARPRVLLLLPMRNAAYDVVQTVLSLVAADGAAEVANKDRFEEEFAPEEDDEIFDESAPESLSHPAEPATKPYDRGSVEKPKDFRYVFRGNIDDDFKFGISLSRKVVKLYSDFYNSDIIIASPLGLRRSLAAKAAGYKGPGKPKPTEEEGDGEWKTGLSADGGGKRETDDDDDGFLSSIELCVLDGMHIVEMQNWDTLLNTMQRVNNIPSSTRDTDFFRVREWALDGQMSRFRQTVVLSAYGSAPLMGLVRPLENHAGRICIAEPKTPGGTQAKVSVSIRQTFVKVEDVPSPAEVPERRIAFFEEQTLSLIRSLSDARTLVVVPTYFDFVRVRNLLVRTQEDDPDFTFATMCEYSRPQDVARARARFYNKQASIVVVTERFHFFWRHWIRGVNTVVFYGLPQNAHFYPEFLNMTNELSAEGNATQCIAIFDKFDAFPLERIVGRARCKHMIARGSKSTFMFVS